MGFYPDFTNPPIPTVKKRIFDELIRRVTAMTDEDGGRLFNQIMTGPIIANQGTVLPMIGLQQGPEQPVAKLWPHVTKITTIYAEWRFARILNVDSLDTFQYYLGKLQQRLFGTPDNITLGGLSVDVHETGNNPEVDDQIDPVPGGMLMFQVQYRHWDGDPYHLPAETPSYAYGNQ